MVLDQTEQVQRIGMLRVECENRTIQFRRLRELALLVELHGAQEKLSKLLIDRCLHNVGHCGLLAILRTEATCQ